MSLHLYSTYYPEQLTPVVFSGLLSQLPPSLVKKVMAYRRWQDAYGSLFGKLLLVRALKEAGFSPDLDVLRVSSYGRPFLDGGPDFNLSHSGNRVVCLLSTPGRVGIDLEEIRNIAFDDFHGQFTASEWAAITGSASPQLAFYRYWTAKESLIKADGKGLQIPLDDIDLGGSANRDSEPPVLLNGNRWYIRSLDLYPGYACHIAADQPVGVIEAEEVSPELF